MKDQDFTREGRDRGDLAWGFLWGSIGGIVTILIMRFALDEEARHDKIFGAWFGFAAMTIIGMLLNAAATGA